MATTAPQPVDPFGDELLEYDDNGSRSSADGYRYAQYGPWIQKRRTAMNGWFAWARWLVLLAIVATLWTGFIGRWFVGGDVDVYHVVHHFTNWSWIFLQLPFYTTVLLAFTLHAVHRWWYLRRERRAGNDEAATLGINARASRWVLTTTVFVAYTAVFVDALFVYVLVFLNTDSIANLWHGHSSDVSVGDLILGNEIYHSWPVFFVILFTALYRDLIYAVYARVFGGVYHILLWSMLYVYVVFGAPTIPVVVYFTIFDPNSIYGVDGSVAAGLAILFVIILTINLPVIYFFTPITLPPDAWQWAVQKQRRSRAALLAATT